MVDAFSDDISAARYLAAIHSQFQTRTPAGDRIALRLIQVTSPRMTLASVDPAGPRYECFSLIFEGADDTPLSQGLCRLEHDALGVADIFIVPVGAERGRRQYEAVFNRRVTPSPLP